MFIQFNFFISPFFHCLLWVLTSSLTANVMSMANPVGCVKICGTEGVKEELGLKILPHLKCISASLVFFCFGKLLIKLLMLMREGEGDNFGGVVKIEYCQCSNDILITFDIYLFSFQKGVYYYEFCPPTLALIVIFSRNLFLSLSSSECRSRGNCSYCSSSSSIYEDKIQYLK